MAKIAGNESIDAESYETFKVLCQKKKWHHVIEEDDYRFGRGIFNCLLVLITIIREVLRQDNMLLVSWYLEADDKRIVAVLAVDNLRKEVDTRNGYKIVDCRKLSSKLMFVTETGGA